ncbi:MAG: MBL fold metallo-hydrolase [Oscillospiraceae bacterium]|nr:MBL fold metallo-hydrolase [Oscillospiraceae bacterium]
MKIGFYGAAHEVTGSCTLLEVGNHRGIVDCGMEQGKDLFVNRPLPCAAGELDFVLLTHAHIDHSGMLPKLCKDGFRGTIYTSAATQALCEIMLRDSANIQESEAEWKNRKAQRSGAAAVEPVYSMEDAEAVLKLFRPCSYGDMIQVNESVSIRLTDVGHLLGSAAIEVWLNENGQERKLCFSGDVGNTGQPILRDPLPVKQAEYLIIESTYGDRLHTEERVDYVAELAARIQRTLDRGGNVVIPSFAVGRTQEILYFIRQIKQRGLVTGHGEFPVYMDSPLAIEATGIFLQCDTDYLCDEMRDEIRSGINPLVFPGLELAVSQEESVAINENKTPKVIISASGMCDAGRVRHHLKHNLWRPESMVLFVGYQAVGTLGRLLVDGAESVKLFNETIHVEAEIETLPGISGHADKNGLLAWLQGFEKKPAFVFVNHGDPESAEAFCDTLNKELGYRAFAPFSGACFDLLENRWLAFPEGVPIEKTTAVEGRKRTGSQAFTELVDVAEKLLKLCLSLEGHANRELRGYTEAIRKLIARIER